MRQRIPMLLLALPLLGCDALGERLDALPGESGGSAARERPEGWESLEGDGAALRLYYQFVDASRQVRFVERLEDVPEPLRASVGFVRMAQPPPLSPGDAARVRRAQLEGGAAAGPASGDARVVLYSAEWCPACRKARRYLARRGVDFELRDVDQPRHAEELRRKTGARAVPVIEVGGRMLTGFSEASYAALLPRA